MCDICMQSPCHPRCPNAPEPVPEYWCSECGEGIFDGDEYFDSQEGPICKNCMEDMTIEEILALCSEELKRA